MNKVVTSCSEEGIFPEFLTLLPGYYANASPESPIVNATVTMALQCASVQPGNSHLALMSRSRYFKAIPAMRNAIQHPTDWDSDPLLAAILLLCIWEVSYGQTWSLVKCSKSLSRSSGSQNSHLQRKLLTSKVQLLWS